MKNYKIKLSVIIPCYNVEKYLDNLFLCLNNVDLENVEYIFINDGSKDSTLNKLVKYTKLNSKCILINQNNKGAAISRNNGLKISRGKYIIFIDSDDVIKPNSLKMIVDALDKENADVLCIKNNHVRENYMYKNQTLKNLHYKKYSSSNLNYIYTQAMAMRDVYVGSPQMFFKKEIIMKMPTYPNIFNDIVGEDCQFNLFCLQYCNKILVSNESYYFYRQRKGSVMHSKFNKKLISILSCNNQLLSGKYNDEVINHTHARNYLNSIYVMQKMINTKYDNKEDIKYVYSIFKNNQKYLKKAKEIIWPIRFFTPLCAPYFYLMLKSKLK